MSISCIRLELLVVAIFALLIVPTYGQTYTLLHTFTPDDGIYPDERLTVDSVGNLYGGAYYGGGTGCGGYGCGTIYRLSYTGKFTVLHSFNGTDGNTPNGGLLRRGGAVYGTAQNGGNNGNCAIVQGCGTIFKRDNKGNFDVLYNFTGGADGSFPGWGDLGLIVDTAGTLYGTAAFGGNPSCPGLEQVPGCGTIFKIDASGQFEVLYSFTGGSDGAYPHGSLVRDSTGNLYGVTETTAFKLDGTGHLTTLHVFSNGSDGGYPYALLLAGNNLFGAAEFGGDPNCGSNIGCGVIYKLNTKTGKQTILHTFEGADGSKPAGLVKDTSGNLWGGTVDGGDFGCGTVFKLNLATTTLTTVYNFTCDQNNTFFVLDLVRDKAGNLYGTTAPLYGYGSPTIFKITPQ
jgi:uncharacterized repeat protein (TIGR03803 family)